MQDVIKKGKIKNKYFKFFIIFECIAKVKIKLIFSYYFVSDKSNPADKRQKNLIK